MNQHIDNRRAYQNIFLLLTGNVLIFTVFWLIQINLSWLAYQLTKSPLLLGLLGFFINLPIIIIIPFGGVFSDKWQRKKIIVISQILYLIPNSILFILVWTHTITYWNMIFVGMMYGAFFAFAKPSSDASAYDVSKTDKHLKIAISLVSSCSQIALLFTPYLSKLVNSLFGLPSVFITCSIANIIGCITFSQLRIQRKISDNNKKENNPFASLIAGIKYVIKNKLLMMYILLISLSLGVIISLQFQFPAIIKALEHGAKTNLYDFYFFSALGGLTGASIIIFRRYTGEIPLNGLLLALILQALTIVALAFSRNMILNYFLAYLLACFGTMATIIGTIAIQKMVTDEKRGRVMALLDMSRIGCIPIASLIIGVINGLLGIYHGLVLFGFLYLITIGIFKFLAVMKRKSLIEKTHPME